MTVFATALATLHADTNATSLVDYRQGGRGPAARIRVIHTILEPSRAPFGQALNTRTDEVQVRIVDAPYLAPNDSLTFDPDGTPWIGVISSKPELDAEGTAYTARLRRQ